MLRKLNITESHQPRTCKIIGEILNPGHLQGTLNKGLNKLNVKPSNGDILCDCAHIISVCHCCVVLILFVVRNLRL
jgi:hypothetical protein